MKGYLANGLFSEADRLYNEKIAFNLRSSIDNLDLYVPQENMAINDKNAYANSKMIAEGDDAFLMNADFMIAVIDGVEIDSGVACEIGTFATLGKPVFALYTDARQLGTSNQKKIDALQADSIENQFMYRNLYVVGKIKNSGGGVYSSIASLTLAVLNHFKG